MSKLLWVDCFEAIAEIISENGVHKPCQSYFGLIVLKPLQKSYPFGSRFKDTLHQSQAMSKLLWVDCFEAIAEIISENGVHKPCQSYFGLIVLKPLQKSYTKMEYTSKPCQATLS
jgi:predicted DNA-binding antitoxin AbrB/MazE fold protein